MPEFPKLEADMVVLLDQMIAGFEQEPGHFTHADIGALQHARAAYAAARNRQSRLEGALKLAVEEKRAALRAMAGVMKAQLRQAEADTAPDPALLRFIGWSPRAAHSRSAPSQPRELRAETPGRQALRLRWRAPRWGDGGRIRTYAVERRAQDAAGAWGEWAHVAVALAAEAALPREPRGVPLEYRVVALNNTGRSNPSNTVSVTL